MLHTLEDSNILKSYIALWIGSLFAFALSGVVTAQCLFYFSMYSKDARARKTIVTTTWILDIFHSSLILAASYDYFVKFFGNWERVDHIPWTVALTVAVTATQTLITHFFFIHRIFRSSNNNYWISIPLAFLVTCRLTAACVSTSEMIQLHKYSSFTHPYPGWIFTTGLSLSAACDVLITAFLCYFIIKMKSRIKSAGMARVADSFVLYTMENGALTCVVTVTSLICWLTMPQNIIFLGLHFVIGKLYANSLLAALNTRKHWQEVKLTHHHNPSKTTVLPPMITTNYTHPNPYLSTQITTQNAYTRQRYTGKETMGIMDTLTCPESVYQGSYFSAPPPVLGATTIARETEREGEVDPRVGNRHWQHHQDDHCSTTTTESLTTSGSRSDGGAVSDDESECDDDDDEGILNTRHSIKSATSSKPRLPLPVPRHPTPKSQIRERMRQGRRRPSTGDSKATTTSSTSSLLHPPPHHPQMTESSTQDKVSSPSTSAAVGDK